MTQHVPLLECPFWTPTDIPGGTIASCAVSWYGLLTNLSWSARRAKPCFYCQVGPAWVLRVIHILQGQRSFLTGQSAKASNLRSALLYWQWTGKQVFIYSWPKFQCLERSTPNHWFHVTFAHNFVELKIYPVKQGVIYLLRNFANVWFPSKDVGKGHNF